MYFEIHFISWQSQNSNSIQLDLWAVTNSNYFMGSCYQIMNKSYQNGGPTWRNNSATYFSFFKPGGYIQHRWMQSKIEKYCYRKHPPSTVNRVTILKSQKNVLRARGECLRQYRVFPKYTKMFEDNMQVSKFYSTQKHSYVQPIIMYYMHILSWFSILLHVSPYTIE